MKTADDFKKAVEENRIRSWNFRKCSLCGVYTKYIFTEDEQVYFDSGCGCGLSSRLQKRSWQDLANLYNMQKNEKYIQELNDFFGFVNE